MEAIKKPSQYNHTLSQPTEYHKILYTITSRFNELQKLINEVMVSSGGLGKDMPTPCLLGKKGFVEKIP